MPPKNTAPQSSPQKPPLVSPYPIAGKPWQRRFPTPRIQDYIVSVREDSRTSEFVMPNKGDVFKGVDQQKRLSNIYKFATAVPVEQLPGWLDLYYVAPFQVQEEYNFTVEYPYADRDYPRFTRTYIVPRTDNVATKEPQADTYDPGFGRPFQLTDHKIERFADDPILDALFVKVMRVFERLPSPKIKSFESNQYQQIVTVETQEVVKSAPPSQSALTEGMKQERTGTAKAKNTLGSVPRVFPNTGLTTEIPSMTRELWLGGFDEEVQAQIQAGQAQQPILNIPGNYSVTEKQLTEYKKEVTTRSLLMPQERHHKETTEQFGGGVLSEDMFIDTPTSPLDIDTGTDVVESRIRNLAGFGKIKMTKRRVDSAWPILHGEHVETDGIYAGIKILFDKQVVAAGTQPDGSGPPYTPNPGGFTDMEPHDKWRTIQITSRVDLNTLPVPITYATVEHIDLPPTLLSIFGTFSDAGGVEQIQDDNNERATVHVISTVSGGIGHTLAEGYKGPARALITRSFFPTAPTLAQIPVPLKIIPVVGTATLIGRHTEFTQSRGLGYNEDGNNGQLRKETIEIRPALTGAFISQNLHFQGASNAAFAQTSDGTYTAQLYQPGQTADIYINIPLSTPGSLVSGQSILWKVDVREWKFGIWVMEVMNVIIP